MDALSDLVSACRAADTEKATERKKYTEKIRQLLNKKSVLKVLDRHSDQKAADSKNEKKLFGWDTLFKKCRNLMWHEVEALQKAKNPDTAAMVKKKQEIAGLIKCIIRLADQRSGHRLKASDVVAHVLSVMRDNFARSCFGVDLTSVLLKDILQVRKYWCELHQNTWHELLALYSKLLREPPPHFDRVVLARIIHCVIHAASQQCDVRAGHLLPIFTDYFIDAKQERSMAVLEHMLGALNALSHVVAADARQQLCRLGESLAIPLLFLWHNRPSALLKDRLIEFFLLQMSVHHPHGSRSEEDGAFAVDWELWKGHMRKMYEGMYNDLEEFGGRHKFSTGIRESIKAQLQDNFVNLFADVCHQLYRECSAGVDVTQVFGATQAGGAVKKRRVESGWQALRHALMTHQHSHLATPWLQLLGRLLQKYPCSLPEEEYSALLTDLTSLLQHSKKVEVTGWCLRCLVTVANSQAHNAGNITEFTVESCQALWKKAWASALRCVSLQHAAAAAFALLEALMQRALMQPDRDIWSIFMPSLSSPSHSSLLFLRTYLEHHDLPDNYRPQYLPHVMQNENYNSKWPLREQLIDWLLPGYEHMSDSNSVATPSLIRDSQPGTAALMAQILVTLVQREGRMESSPDASHNEVQCVSNPFQTIEDVYMKTSFLDCDEETKNDVPVKNNIGKINLIESLYTKVMEFLLRDCNHLLETTESQGVGIEEMCACLCTCVHVLCELLGKGCFTPQQLSRRPLLPVLKELIDKFNKQLSDALRKDAGTTLLGVLSRMQNVYSYFRDSLTGLQASAEIQAICRALLQPCLFQQCSSVLREKTLSRTTSNASVSKTSAATEADDFDLFDDEPSTSNNNGFDADFADMTESPESQESDAFSPTDKGSESLLSKSSLGEKDCLKLELVRLLCLWLVGQHEPSSVTLLQTHITPNQVYDDLLLDLIDEQCDWDVHKAYDLQMMEMIVEELSDTNHKMTEDSIECFLEALRTICKHHRKDQTMCSLVLRLLARLVPHLCKDTNSQSMRMSRGIALSILGVFWRYSQEGQYGSQTRMALAKAMAVFAQEDPEQSWAQWKNKAAGDPEQFDLVHDKFIDFVADPHHSIRLMVASSLHFLFVRDASHGKEPLPTHQQNESFDLVYRALQLALNLQARLSPDEQRADETRGRTSSMLHTLCTMARHSLVCEKKAVFAVCQMAKERNLPDTMLHKVLARVATHLQYADTRSLMTSHLPYIVQQWLESSYDVIDLPHQLLGYKQQLLFFKEQHKVVVPWLVMSRQFDSLKRLARLLNADTSQLLEVCVVPVLVHILPHFAASKSPQLSEKPGTQSRSQHATKAYDALLQHVKQQVVEQQIVKYMPELVVSVLMTLRTPGPRGCDPELNPPCLSVEMIECTLAYISTCHGAKSLVTGIAKQHQDGIQKILLALVRAMRLNHVMHEKWRVLHMYKLFVTLLLREFHEQLGGSWAFVLRDTLYTLLYNIASAKCGAKQSKTQLTSYKAEFIVMCLDLLSSVCNIGIEHCPKELGMFLSTMVAVLSPLTDSEDEIGTKSGELLHTVLVASAESLRFAIALLDPLPDTPALQRARAVQQRIRHATGKPTLHQEVRHFLQAGREGVEELCDRKEGLRCLQQLLAHPEHKRQLRNLINQAHEEEDGGVVGQLLYELTEIAKRNSNTSVALQAASCLGEIGPAQLHVSALKGLPRYAALNHAIESYNGQPEQHKYCLIFHLLNHYLVCSSVSLVEAASEVLKQILSTRTGINFSNDYKVKVNDNLFYFLHPFKASKKKALALPEPRGNQDAVRSKDLWCPPHAAHDTWITRLCITLIQSGAVRDEVLRLLAPICTVKPSFCEEVVPLLIHDILLSGTEEHREMLSENVGSFFAKHSAENTTKENGVSCKTRGTSKTVCTEKESIEALLKVVQYLRVQNRPVVGRGKVSTAWDNNFWLELDYLQLAEAALSCGAYFTAILYAQLWCFITWDGQLLNELGAEEQLSGTILSVAVSSCGERGQRLQHVLLEAYRCVGDPDAMYGCGGGATLATAQARTKMYEHEGKWQRALSTYDVLLQQQSQQHLQPRLMQSLYLLGSNHILDTYLAGVGEAETNGQREIRYQAALRNTKWHLSTPTRVEDIQGYHEAVYTGLCSVRDSDPILCDRALQIAKKRTLSELETFSVESWRSCYPALAQLHCSTLLDDARRLLLKDVSMAQVMEKWTGQDTLLDNDFEFVEPVLTTRCALLSLLGEVTGEAQAKPLLCQQLENLAVQARAAGRFQVAEGALERLRWLCGGQQDAGWSWRIEEARLFWARAEHDTAKHLLRSICTDMQQVSERDIQARKWYPVCLSMLGNWLAETLAENPKVVMDEYLSKAVDVHQAVNSRGEDRLDAHLALARYADGQYQGIVNHMKSSSYEEKQNLYKKAREEIDQLVRMGDKGSRYVRTLQKQWSIDDQEEKALHCDRKSYLSCAVQNYLSCLRYGDKHDLRVFRLTSLWFDNTNLPEISTMVKEGVPQLGSHKFLPLMYQLAARMSSCGSAFADTLDQLIERCSLDHPYHTMFIVLALAHANKDDEILQGRSSKKASGRLARGASSQDSQTRDYERVLAAKQMVERLKGSRRSDIIQDMERLCVAYIQLANFNVDQHRKETRPINLPSALMITKLKELTHAAIPTAEVPVDLDCSYEDITYVREFAPTFKLAGGINLPKIISCVGSDGVSRRQLVKGKDDLRQDAVMQQVFGMVNKLLHKDQQTRVRKLTVRQYKVIPLSQRSGLLEWCEGTMPLGEYLIGSNGAHQRYRPRDMRAAECRALITDAKAGKIKLTKYQAFLKVCESFQPVFRHFFLEHFLEPSEWFQRRLVYTRSVATNSIVGYILGLGDRHVQNILIDTKTAEMVHIDLGVAFEQGKILPTPETVPFRLTRDVIDGMGVEGVEGVFRRCCEKTMAVLHDNHEALLTILEVLLYDPLYAWTLSPEKAAQLQLTRDLDQTADVTVDEMDEPHQSRSDDAGERVNKVAGRALLRLQQKLQGLEEGVQLSVNGQVNKLIQEARDPNNLCRLFPGWQPYI